jgi:hypothetical protein
VRSAYYMEKNHLDVVHGECSHQWKQFLLCEGPRIFWFLPEKYTGNHHQQGRTNQIGMLLLTQRMTNWVLVPLCVTFQGMVHAAFCYSMDVLVDPVVADALAALHTAEFCRNRGYTRLILEEDSLLVAQAINCTWVNWSRHENIIVDIREVLTSIYHWKTCNTKRRANSAAHILAHVGGHHATHRIWIGCIIDCIREIVLLEITYLIL